MVTSKFLSPKNDVAFRKIFGSEKHKDILIHFINDILDLKGDNMIKQVAFLSTIQDPDIAYKKESPQLGKHLPSVLSICEVEAIIKAIDHSTPTGIRNRAIVETLYGTGVRVSELIALKLSHIYFEESFLRVIGKGNKERLIPIGAVALKYISIYLEEVRGRMVIKPNYLDTLFLNQRGSSLSRVMVFFNSAGAC